MSQVSEQSISGWATVGVGVQAGKSASEAQGSLQYRGRFQSGEYRSRLLWALAFSGLLHAGFFLAEHGAKPVVIAPKVATPLAMEKFRVPLEDPPEVAEVEFDQQPQPLNVVDFAPPSQAELMTLPISSDFVMEARPQLENLGKVDTTAIRLRSGSDGVLAAPAKVFTLAELDRAPVIVHQVRPVYPHELEAAHIHGSVVVHFLVNADGSVSSAEVVSTPHPLLGLAVVRSLEKWRFKAGTKAGKAVITAMELPVRFNAERG